MVGEVSNGLENVAVDFDSAMDKSNGRRLRIHLQKAARRRAIFFDDRESSLGARAYVASSVRLTDPHMARF